MTGVSIPPRLEPKNRVIVKEPFYGLGKVDGGGELHVGTRGVVKDIIVDAAYIEFEGHVQSYCVILEQYSHLDVVSEAVTGSAEADSLPPADDNQGSHSEHQSSEVPESLRKSVYAHQDAGCQNPQPDGNGVIREQIGMIVDMIGDVVVGAHGTAPEKPLHSDAAPLPDQAGDALQRDAVEAAEQELTAPNGLTFRPASRVVAKDAFYSHGKWYGGAQLLPGTAGIVNEVLEDGVYVQFDGIYGTCHVTVDQLSKLDLAPEQGTRLQGEALRADRLRRLFEVDDKMETNADAEAERFTSCTEAAPAAGGQDPSWRGRITADRSAEGRFAVQAAMWTQRQQALQKLQGEAERATQLLEERAASNACKPPHEVLRPNPIDMKPLQ